MANKATRALLLPLALLAACDDPSTDEADSELRVGLWGQSSSGQLYALHGTFEIDDLGAWSTEYLGDDEPSELNFNVNSGSHTVTLSQWRVTLGEHGDPYPVGVPATLLSPNPLGFTTVDGLTTDVTFEFEIEGEGIGFGQPSVHIDAEFEEDDGVCQPVPDLDGYLFDFSGQEVEMAGDGWQSFTAPRDGLVTYAAIQWNGWGSEGFTLEVREGIGPNGTLVGTLESPAFGEGGDWAALSWAPALTAFQLDEGAVYTVVSSQADGWLRVSGARAGATSSDGNDYHRGLIIWASECT